MPESEKKKRLTRTPSPVPGTRRRRISVMIALIIVAGGIAAWRHFLYRSRTEQGIEALQAAYNHARALEARLTLFDYAPLVVTRGEENNPAEPAMRDRAGLLLSEGDRSSWNAQRQHAVALYYLTDGKTDQAIALLGSALALEPNNADIHSDLSAAYLERAVTGRARPAIHDLARSLEESSRAIELNGSLLAARFNRALCLQRMQLCRAAMEAWNEYYRLDADSGWSGEAARNSQLLREEDSRLKTPGEVLEEFLAALREKNEVQAWRIHSQTREMITGTMVPFQLARRLTEARLTGRNEISKELLAALTSAAKLEKKQTGDLFFVELAQFYAGATKESSQLAKAQEAMQRGFQLCLKGSYRSALTCFEEGQKLYQVVGNRWESRAADYWIAYCYSQFAELDRSIELLSRLADYCERRSYHWLRAEAIHWLSTNSTLLREYSRGIEQSKTANGIAGAIGDLYNTQKSAAHLARNYTLLSQPGEAIEFHQLSMPAAGDYFVSARQYSRSLNSLTDTLSSLGLYAAAEAYQQEALEVALSRLGDPVLIHNTYVRLAQIQIGRQNYHAAERSLQSSLETIEPIKTDRAMQKLLGQSALQLGNIRRRSGDYTAALDHYNQALQMFESIKASPFAYVTRKGMLQCHLLNNDDAAVRQELPAVLSLFEENRLKIKEEQNRNHFFDAEQDIYDLAIDYEYSSNNTEASFNYAELSRARSLLDNIIGGANRGSAGILNAAGSQPLTLTRLQERMPDNLQLIQYAVLQNRLLIWVVTKSGSKSIHEDVPLPTLEAAVNEYLRVLLTSDTGSIERERELARQLHDWLIAPVEEYLDREKETALIPDKFLFKIPFAALLSRSGRRVIEDYTLLYDPSATVLALCADLAGTKPVDKQTETLLSVGNPAFDRRRYPNLDDLPNAAAEAKRIASFYSSEHAVFIRDEAIKEQIEPKLLSVSVIHFATHYVTDRISPSRSKLLLAAAGASGNEAAGALSLEEIRNMRLTRAKLAVLAACQSGIERYYAGEGSIGLSRAFIIAGVPLVVASQWSVETDSTYELMVDFHRLRKLGGLSTTRALRQAQLNMLRHENRRYQQPYYWAGFFAFGAHADY